MKRRTIAKNLVEFTDGRRRRFGYRFRVHEGIERVKDLGTDLVIAKRLLKEAKAHDTRCKMLGVSFDDDERAAKLKAEAERQAADRERHRLRVDQWLEWCKVLPESRSISAGKRNGQARASSTLKDERSRFAHLSRILGDRWLDRLGSRDGDAYEAARRKERIIKHGKQTGGFIQSGTIRNELRCLLRVHGWAKRYGSLMRECEDAGDVRRLVEHSGLPEHVLRALMDVQNTPQFNIPTVPPRARVLSVDELRRFWIAAKKAPAWFQRFSVLLSECGLDVSSVINLTEHEVHWDKQEIVVRRRKTGELHVAPLTKLAAEAIRAQLAVNTVQNVQRRIFSWEDDPSWPVSGSQVAHYHQQVCREAKVAGFWARDWRHCFGTRWAAKPEVSDAVLKLMMGWSQGSSMGRTYFNLQSGAVGAVAGGK